MNNNYIGVDLDIFRRPEIKKLRKALGNEAVLVYIELFITLGELGQIPFEDLELYADEFNVELDFLFAVINFRNLFIIENDSVSIQEVLDKLNIIFQKSDKARLKALKRWQDTKNNNATAMLQHSYSNANAMQLKENKIKEIKLNENKEKERESENFLKFSQEGDRSQDQKIIPPLEKFDPTKVIVYREPNETDEELKERVERMQELYKDTGKTVVIKT